MFALYLGMAPPRGTHVTAAKEKERVMKRYREQPQATERWRKAVEPMRLRIDQREAQLYAADRAKHVTFVMDTSVANHAGLGLYALRTIEKDAWLPYAYPGEMRTNVEFEKLDNFLVYLTRQETWLPEQVEWALAELKTCWNVEVKRFFPSHSTSAAAAAAAAGSGYPNWDIIYDTFQVYRFATGRYTTFYWNKFDWSGAIYVHEENQANAGLFINEPPPYERFTNRFTLKGQMSQTNVVFKTRQTATGLVIMYQATRRITRGQELLTNYGPFYYRVATHGMEYDINLSDESVEDHRAGPDTHASDFKRLKCYRDKIRAYRPISRRFETAACKDELEVIQGVQALREAREEDEEEDESTPTAVSQQVRRRRGS